MSPSNNVCAISITPPHSYNIGLVTSLPPSNPDEPLSTEELATLDHGLGASHHAYPTPSSNPSRDQLPSNTKTPHSIYSVPNASGSLTVNSLLSARAPETVSKRKSQNSLAKSFRRVSSAVSLSKDKSDKSLDKSLDKVTASSATTSAVSSSTAATAPTTTTSDTSLHSPTAANSRSNLQGVPESHRTSRNNSQVNIPPVPPLPQSTQNGQNGNYSNQNGNTNHTTFNTNYLSPNSHTIYNTVSHSSDISPNTSTANIPTIVHSDGHVTSNINPTRSNMSTHSGLSALSNANDSVDSFQSVTQDFSEVVLVPTDRSTLTNGHVNGAHDASNGASPLPTSASQFARSTETSQKLEKELPGLQHDQVQQKQQFDQVPRQQQSHTVQPPPVQTQDGAVNGTVNVTTNDSDSVSVDSPVDDDPAMQSAVESVQSRVGESQQSRLTRDGLTRDGMARDSQFQSQSQPKPPSFAQSPSLAQTHSQAIPVRSANKEFVPGVAPPSSGVTGSSSRPSLAAAMRGGLSDTPAIPMAAATTAVSSMSPKSQNSMTESVSALSSPASSMIFERNVQEFSVAATSGGASSSKIWNNHDNTHYHGEDRVAPALDASTEAIINSKVNPEDIDVISLRRPSSIRARSPTEASLNSLWSPGSPTMLQDAASSGPRTRNNSMSVHPLTASHTGGSLSPDKLNGGGDGRQVLSFCSFADVVHTENEETNASSDRLGRFDTRSQSALRSPSPLMRQHHPVSPSMAESVVADLKLTIPPSRSATVDSVDSESPIVVSSFGETIRRRTSELGL